jgi:hypothetical protein
MSEDVTEKLGRFSPKAVDRDAMLFEAGRASAKPSRFWKVATFGLLLSQSLTLGLWLWPRSSPTLPTTPPKVSPTILDDTPPPPPDPYSILALSRNPDTVSTGVTSPGPSRTPLTAFTRNFQP